MSKDVVLLIDILLDCYDNPSLAPSDGTTFCNIAADRIAEAFGYKALNALTADQIFNLMNNNPDWVSVSIMDAQNLANQGSLVFAVASSQMLGQSHGHLCAVRPGKTVDSGKWGMVPRVCNIGIENFIARAKKGPLTGLPCGVNESFIPKPLFYALQSTL